MPVYYNAQRSVSTNATQNTSNAADMLFLTGTGVDVGIASVSLSSNVVGGGTSLSGAAITFTRFSTAGTGGSAYTPRRADPAPTATLAATVTTVASTGTTAAIQRTIGCAAPGGAGGWMAIEPDNQMVLKGGGGANGNIEVATIAGLASVPIVYTTDFNER